MTIAAARAADPAGIYNIMDYGAKGDGMNPDTLAIRRAVDTCAAIGDGQVLCAVYVPVRLEGFVEADQRAGRTFHVAGERRGVGDVSNLVFANGWVARKNGEGLIYYGSPNTRNHVAKTTVDKLLDYCLHTSPDARRSKLCVVQRCELIAKNLRRRAKC